MTAQVVRGGSKTDRPVSYVAADFASSFGLIGGQRAMDSSLQWMNDIAICKKTRYFFYDIDTTRYIVIELDISIF